MFKLSNNQLNHLMARYCDEEGSACRFFNLGNGIGVKTYSYGYYGDFGKLYYENQCAAHELDEAPKCWGFHIFTVKHRRSPNHAYEEYQVGVYYTEIIRCLGNTPEYSSVRVERLQNRITIKVADKVIKRVRDNGASNYLATWDYKSRNVGLYKGKVVFLDFSHSHS